MCASYICDSYNLLKEGFFRFSIFYESTTHPIINLILSIKVASTHLRKHFSKMSPLKTFETCHLNLTAVWESSGHCNAGSDIYLTSSFGCELHFYPLWPPQAVSQHDTVPSCQTVGCSSSQLRLNMDLRICFVPTLSSWSHTLCNSLHIKFQGVLGHLSGGTVRAQMTNAAISSTCC